MEVDEGSEGGNGFDQGEDAASDAPNDQPDKADDNATVEKAKLPDQTQSTQINNTNVREVAKDGDNLATDAKKTTKGKQAKEADKAKSTKGKSSPVGTPKKKDANEKEVSIFVNASRVQI